MIRPGDLEEMDRAALLTAWSELYGSPAPLGISRRFLRRFLAFDLQARRSGGLPKQVMAALKASDPHPGARPATPALAPGGRLLREWNGVTHVVEVTEAGYRWSDQTWRSLSVIAREITGAHWSGPRFFGVKGRARQ